MGASSVPGRDRGDAACRSWPLSLGADGSHPAIARDDSGNRGRVDAEQPGGVGRRPLSAMDLLCYLRLLAVRELGAPPQLLPPGLGGLKAGLGPQN